MKNTYTGKTRLFLAISGAIIAVALIMQIVGVGLNLGVDFTGGSILSYSVGEAYDVGDVEMILRSAGHEGGQITKAAPSAASIALQAELAEQKAAAEAAAAEEAVAAEEAAAAETEAAAEEAVEAVEEVAEEAAAEEPAEEAAPAETMLNLDKSGIKDDGMTDLELRLKIVNETEHLEEDMDAAVRAVLPEANRLNYELLTNSVIVNRGFEGRFAGGYVAEYEIGKEFDSAEVLSAVSAALGEKYAIEEINAVRYDATVAEEAAPAEEPAEGAEEAAPAEEEEAAEEETAEEEEAPVEESGTALRVLISVEDQASQVRALLEKNMSAKYENFRFVSIDHVSAIAGRDLLSNAVKALLIAFACMLVYIALRFDLFSGLAALFGLAHDVLIMCSIMVFFRAVYQVNSSFIAAILTIVGYSINNTIIIFDRIRETRLKPGYTQKSRREIVEDSVSHTISRTINTTVTTLITLVALYIFGVESIREFAFPLIVGMIAGTYSSVLLSGQVWAMWMDRRAEKKAAAQPKSRKA